MTFATKKKATKATKPKVIKPGPQNDTRPVLIKCGRAFVDPNDVSAIIQVRADLWIVKLKSEPNPQYPIWLHENGFERFAPYFNLVGLAPDGDLEHNEDQLGPPEVAAIKYR